jgi:hypothetical protein
VSTDEAIYGLVKRAVTDALRELRHPAAEPEPELVKLSEARKLLGVSESWLKARIAGGELEAFGTRRMRRVKPADVRALMTKRPGPAKAEEPRAVALRLLGGRK